MSSSSVRKVVCLQWSDQYVSITLISVKVGSLFSTSLKYSCTNRRSAGFIARPIFFMKPSSALESIAVKPSSISTVSGISSSIFNVSGLSRDAILLSTGFTRCSMTLPVSAFVILPSITMTLAVLTMGCASSERSRMHWAHESALWSNWPGRYS